MSQATNIPMTRPEEMLAVHHTNYAHSVTWVQLDCGRIVMGVWSEFTTSDDGGLSWSEAFASRKPDGQEVQASAASLVKLDNGSLGLTSKIARR